MACVTKAMLRSLPGISQMSQIKKVFHGQKFSGVIPGESDRPLKGLECRQCYFEGCALSVTVDPSKRTLVRNVSLIDCEQRGGSINQAILEDVFVYGLETHGTLQTFGAVFKHVTLKGKIGSIMFTPFVDLFHKNRAMQRAFDKANSKYYTTVDWALDIAEAHFEDCVFRTVPARLIRRDPQTQVVVKRANAAEDKWRKLKYVKGTRWEAELEFFLDEGNPDIVLVAPKRDRQFRHVIDGLKALRDAGIAELD